MEDILPCEVNLENLTLERVQFYTVVKHRRDVKAFEVLKKSIRKNISLLKWRVSNAIARSKKVEEGMPIVKTSKITRESKLIALMKKENAGFQKSTKYDEGKTKRRGRSKLYVYNDLISDSETEEPPKIVYKRTRKRKNDSLTDNNSKSSDSPVSSNYDAVNRFLETSLPHDSSMSPVEVNNNRFEGLKLTLNRIPGIGSYQVVSPLNYTAYNQFQSFTSSKDHNMSMKIESPKIMGSPFEPFKSIRPLSGPMRSLISSSANDVEMPLDLSKKSIPVEKEPQTPVQTFKAQDPLPLITNKNVPIKAKPKENRKRTPPPSKLKSSIKTLNNQNTNRIKKYAHPIKSSKKKIIPAVGCSKSLKVEETVRKSEKSPETEKLAESPRVLIKQVIIETPSVQEVSELISSKPSQVIILSKVMAPTVKAKSRQITTKHIKKELVKPLVLEAPKVPKLSIASFPRIPKINKNPKVGPLILGIRDPRLEKRMLAEKIPTPAPEIVIPEIVIPEIVIPEIVIPEIASESSSDSESDSLEGSDSSDSSNRQVKSDCSVDHENKVKETKPEAEESKVDPPKDDIEKLETSDLESDHENYDDDFVELNASDGFSEEESDDPKDKDFYVSKKDELKANKEPELPAYFTQLDDLKMKILKEPEPVEQVNYKSSSYMANHSILNYEQDSTPMRVTRSVQKQKNVVPVFKTPTPLMSLVCQAPDLEQTKEFNTNTEKLLEGLKLMEKKMLTVPEMPKNLSRFMGNLCLTYLSGACQIAYPCKYSHITLPERSLKANVANASDIEVIECYELSLQYMKLFRLYFRVFCEIFGLRKMQSKLVKMIGDFEVKGRPTECYKYIAKALESCGMDSVDVVKTIISNNKVHDEFTDNVLVGLIADTNGRIGLLTNHLRHFNNHLFPVYVLTKLLKNCIENGNMDLCCFMNDYLKLHRNILDKIDRNIILQFTNVMTQLMPQMLAAIPQIGL